MKLIIKPLPIKSLGLIILLDSKTNFRQNPIQSINEWLRCPEHQNVIKLNKKEDEVIPPPLYEPLVTVPRCLECQSGRPSHPWNIAGLGPWWGALHLCGRQWWAMIYVTWSWGDNLPGNPFFLWTFFWRWDHVVDNGRFLFGKIQERNFFGGKSVKINRKSRCV